MLVRPPREIILSVANIQAQLSINSWTSQAISQTLPLQLELGHDELRSAKLPKQHLHAIRKLEEDLPNESSQGLHMQD